MRALNPVCCVVANDIVFWPFFLIAIFTFFLGICHLVAAAANIGLTTYPKDLDEHYQQLAINDYIVLAALVILGLILLFYLLFRPAPVFQNRYSGGIQGFNVDDNGNLIPKSTFVPVRKEISANRTLNSNCFSLLNQNPPSFEIEPKTCTGQCGISAGLLIVNGTFDKNSVQGGSAKLGSDQFRSFFFPQATNTNDDFIHLYGTPEEVQRSLALLIACSNTKQSNSKVALHAFQYDVNKLNEYALTNGQRPVYIQSSQNGTSPDLSNYTVNNTVCKEACKYIIASNNLVSLKLIGKLLIKDYQQKVTNYGIPESDVTIFLQRIVNGMSQNIGAGSYGLNGFEIITQVFDQGTEDAQVRIEDPSGKYLPNTIDVKLTSSSTGSLYLGDIFLITKSGLGCKNINDLQATDACFKNMQVNKYDLTINMMTLDNKLEGPVNLKIYKTQSVSGPVVSDTQETQPKKAIQLPAGYYLVEISGDKYKKSYQKVNLDQHQTVNVELQPNDEVYRIYKHVDLTVATQDLDLNLKMKTSSGEECVVNHLNRQCPYVQYQSDIQLGQQGYELITVSQFVDATYMVFLSKSPDYVANCTLASAIPKRMLQGQINFNRNHHKIQTLANGLEVYTTGLQGENSSSFINMGEGNNFFLVDPIKVGNSPIVGNIIKGVKSLFSSQQMKSLPSIDSLYSNIFSEGSAASSQQNEKNIFISALSMLFDDNQVLSYYNQNHDDFSINQNQLQKYLDNDSFINSLIDNEYNETQKSEYSLVDFDEGNDYEFDWGNIYGTDQGEEQTNNQGYLNQPELQEQENGGVIEDNGEIATPEISGEQEIGQQGTSQPANQ